MATSISHFKEVSQDIKNTTIKTVSNLKNKQKSWPQS